MRGMVPEDLYEMQLLGDPRVSPDGEQVAFTIARLDREKNEYTSRIWMADVGTFDLELVEAGGTSPTIRTVKGQMDKRPFTTGEHRDSKPRWSPTGELLAFVSHRDEKGSQLYVMPATGGEPRRVCEFKEEIEEVSWSPDGGRIALLVRDPREEVYGEDKPKNQAPRVIDVIVNRLDNVGWTIDRPRQVWVIDIESDSEAKALTSGPHDCSGLTWSPDGNEIAFASSRHKGWDFDRISDVYIVGSRGGELRKLTQTDSGYSLPSWSPDGSSIAVGWSPTPMNSPRHGRIAVIDVNTGQRTALTEELDRNATPFFGMREPVWGDGDVYFLVEDAGDQHLYRAPADGTGKPERVAGENGHQVAAFDLVAGTLAYIQTSPTGPGSLLARSPATVARAEEELDRIRPKLRDVPPDFSKSFGTKGLAGTGFGDGIELVTPIKFTATSKDGSEVEAWCMRPAGFDVDKKYPMLLNIHGGPFTQYGNRFFDEFQVYCGAGYVVVYSNPRGSSGYSESWARAIRGPLTDSDPGSGWGGVDYEDLMAVVDAAIERFPFIEPTRLGVMGGSYGGFMTSWIIGHTDRFKAAVSERAVNNHLSMCWTSDIGPYFRSYFGPVYLDNPQEYLRMSPITYVRDITTPVLILHSENDLRCPISQADELFTALKILGRDVEFVRFPGESHELSRSGAPKHREERFRVILDFLSRRL